MKGFIYYFTGTGNSMALAKRLTDRFDGMEMVKITAELCANSPEVDAEMLGFVYPVYAFGPPLLVTEFLEKLTVKRADYTFVITASGDTPGNAMKRFEALCQAQNIRLDSSFLIEMPGNYIIEEDPPSAEEVTRLLTEADQILEGVFASLEKREKIPAREIPDPPDPFFSEIKKQLLSNASQGYQGGVGETERAVIEATQNRYDIFTLMCKQMDHQFGVMEECTGCAICEMICPVENIVMNDSDRPEWKHECELCLACLSWCPEDVIHFAEQTLGRAPYRHPDYAAHDLIADNARDSA